ncbi:MAG: hypothetical protein WBQ86_22530 [Candidatus Binatus sp.]
MAFFALTVVLGTANQAWAGKRHRHSQPTPVTDAGTACGGSITPSTLFMGTANTGPFEVGNTVTVNAVILNTNPVNFVVTNVVDELSCIEIPSPFNFFTCNSSFSSGPDDDSISYAANIQTDCGVTWNADTSVAGVVTFTPATTLTLSPGASCHISFDETINNPGVATPGTIFAFDADDGNCQTAPPSPGSAQGSISFNVATCGVAVDKQVSCDGGVTFHDVSGVDDTDPGSLTLGCMGFNAFGANPASQIEVRYQAKNTGNTDATCLTSNSQGLSDSNTVLIPSATSVSIPTSDSTYMTIDTVGPTACSTGLAALEPDTATLSCECATGNTAEPTILASAMDSATFTCASPQLNVMKTCGPATASGNSAVVVSYETGTGAAPLDTCTLTDQVFSGACVSGAPAPGATLVDTVTSNMAVTVGMSPATTDLTASGLTTANCGAGDDCCNQASVTCDVTGSGTPEKTITAANVANCAVPELDVSKTCGPAVDGSSAVTVTASAPGAPLDTCTLTDQVFSGACVAPGVPAPGATVVDTVTTNMPITVGTTPSTTDLTASGLTGTTCNGVDCCNTASVTCNISGTGTPEATITTAAVAQDCPVPELMVSKSCGAQDPTTGDSPVTVTYSTATGAPALNTCTLTDQVFSGACVGGAPAAGATVVDTVTTDMSIADATSTAQTISGLNAMGLSNLLCGGADCCNQATVSCDVTGTSGTISSSNVANCPAPAPPACIDTTLTWGYWKNHTGSGHPRQDPAYQKLSTTCPAVGGVGAVTLDGDCDNSSDIFQPTVITCAEASNCGAQSADALFSGGNGGKVNCSGKCVTLFAAQFLAAQMTLVGNPALGGAIYVNPSDPAFNGQSLGTIITELQAAFDTYVDTGTISCGGQSGSFTACQNTLDAINSSSESTHVLDCATTE